MLSDTGVTYAIQHTSAWHTFWMIPRILIELITFFRHILIKSTSLHLYHRVLFHFTYPHPFPFVHICCRFYEPPEVNTDTYMCVPKLWPSIHAIWGGISPRITLMDWVNTVNKGLPLDILINIYRMMPTGHNTSGLFKSLVPRYYGRNVIRVGDLGHHWFCLITINHYLNQCWLIFNMISKNLSLSTFFCKRWQSFPSILTYHMTWKFFKWSLTVTNY